MASPLAPDAGGSEIAVQSSAESGEQATQENGGSVDRITKFIKKGEEILETFTASARGFDTQTAQIKRLEKAILEMARDNKKRKMTDLDETDVEHSSAKRGRVQSDPSDSDSGEESDPFETLDKNLNGKEQQEQDEDIVAEMDDFFATEEQLGPKVAESVAQSIDGALKRPISREKMEEVLERNKRPENVPRPQVPNIDHFLWDQLQNATKSKDAQQQKSVVLANQAAVPLIRAMDHLKTAQKPEISVLRECITDAFKILAHQITGINQKRREIIKQEIRPNLRAVCEDQAVSATKLFGDDLAEKVKQVDSGKVNITSGNNKQPFLGKRQSSEKRDNHYYRDNQHYRNQNNRKQQNNKKSFHGKNSQKKSGNSDWNWRKYGHKNKN